MKKQLLRITVFCAACLALGAQAQTSSGGSSGTSGGSTSDQSGQSGYSGSSSSQSMSPTGRMGQHEVQASKLKGAKVTGTSGETLGTLNDTIINPSSGKIDFAILSLTGGGGVGGAISGATGGAVGGKQVAVPWQLLRPSPMGGGAEQTPSFVFTGDSSKLQSAPTFNASTDLSQPSWRQSVFSYFGMSPSGTATGGAETPGGGGTYPGGGTPPGGDSSGGGSSGNP